MPKEDKKALHHLELSLQFRSKWRRQLPS